MGPLLFIVLCFANWRISHMIAAEEGPANIFGRIRNWTGVRYDKNGVPYGTNNLSRGILCVWCVSVWVGFLLAVLVINYVTVSTLADAVSLPFAISTGAIIIEALVNGR